MNIFEGSTVFVVVLLSCCRSNNITILFLSVLHLLFIVVVSPLKKNYLIGLSPPLGLEAPSLSLGGA